MNNEELYSEVIKNMDSKDIDNHESDLYIKVNPVSKELINNYEFKNNVTTFKDDVNKELWYEVPFAYIPFWNNN